MTIREYTADGTHTDVKGCIGGPDWNCEAPAQPGDVYCGDCRDANERLDAVDGYDPAEPWRD